MTTQNKSIEKLFYENKTMGFVSREKPNPVDIDSLRRSIEESIIKQYETSIIILRPILFFHSEQPGVTIGKLREFFTEKAIQLFELDGYIKIKK